jgi:3-oxoacyl-[acyl-carrier-protein] synthase II
VGESYEIIKRGDADAMIAGGTEAAITPMSMGGFAALRALSTRNEEPHRASRPFDKERDGFVIGEGAGVVIMEELESARRRGARIYAEVMGYGSTADAAHITFPDPDGEANAMLRALKDAGVAPAEIDHINAHGTATKLNDASETEAVKRVFGNRAYEIPINSIKSMIGHSMGAAGAIEFIATILAIDTKIIPPTINYEEADPQCDLDYVTEGAREMKGKAPLRTAMSNSFGFGGNNAVLVTRAFTG